MPSLTKTAKGGVIRWDKDDWLEGLSSLHLPTTTGAKAIPFTTPGLIFGRAIDPNRKPGYIQPGGNGANVTNNTVIDGTLRAGTVHGSTAYMVGGIKLHSMTLSNDTMTAALRTIAPAAPNHTGHTVIVGHDVAFYSIKNGATVTPYIFYSWTDQTDGDVGSYNLNTAAVDEDHFSTATSGAVLAINGALNVDGVHPMIVGDDNKLYIGNGRFVASLDGNDQGATGLANNAALDLPVNYTIRAFAKLPNYLVIFAYLNVSTGGSFYRAEATAFFWDYVSDSFTYSYPLNGNYVGGGFTYQNTVGCFVQGRVSELGSNKQARMMLFDGSKFVPQVRFRGNIPEWGSVEVIDDVVYFQTAIGDSRVYQWGSPHIGMNDSFNWITEGAGTNSGHVGLLKAFADGSVYVSSGTTTSGGLQKFSQTGYATNSSFLTALYQPRYPKFSRGRIEMVKIYWGGTSSTHQFSFTLFTDAGATTTTVLSNLASVTSLVTEYFEDTSAAPLPSFKDIGINGSWTTTSSESAPPIIEAVEVYYEDINV